MTIEEAKHADLQKAVLDINTVLGTKQNKVAGRQHLIDFIVNTIGGYIGPNPENPEEQIWTNPKAADLKPETLATYETLATSAAEQSEAGQPKPSGESGEAKAAQEEVDKLSGDLAKGHEDLTQSAAQPKECPEFGKGYDPEDPACAKPCKRGEECQTIMSEATPKKTGDSKKPKEPKAPAADRYGYVHAAYDAILSGDMSRNDLAKKMVELYSAKGKTGDVKQARRNLDSDLRSLLVFGVVNEESGKIILANRG